MKEEEGVKLHFTERERKGLWSKLSDGKASVPEPQAAVRWSRNVEV